MLPIGTERENMKLEKELIDYLNLTGSTLKTSTILMHQRHITHICNACRELKINSLKKLELNHGYLLVDWLKKNTNNGNNSINKIMRYLKSVLIHYKILSTFNDFKLLPSDTKPFKRFYQDELEIVIQFVDQMAYTKNSLIYKTLVFLLLDSGMRLSEALNIKIENIDFTTYTILLTQTKTSKVRIAPFSDFSFESIRKLIERNPSREYLFFNFLKNRRVSKNDVKLFYRRLQEKTGIKKIHSHRFRKTFGSKLAENGMPIQYIQTIYDHSRLETTMIYINYRENQALEEYKKYHRNWVS
ncbi:MAG: site-specific integrase [Candidatus Aenigmatarchaeota archaeon]